MIGIGLIEVVFLLFPFLFGGGAPLGVPPGEDDPVLWTLAKEADLVYTYWPARATAVASGSPTEQYMAQPEWAPFFARLRGSLKVAMQANLNADEPRAAELMAVLVDELAWGILDRPTCSILRRVDWPEMQGVEDAGPDEPAVHALLVLQLGPERARLDQAWQELLKIVDAGGSSFERVRRGDRSVLELSRMSMINRVYLEVRDGYLLVSIGLESLDDLNLTPPPPISKPEWMVDLEVELNVERRGSVARVNVAELVDGVERTTRALRGFDPFSDNLLERMKGIRAIRVVSGLDSEGMITRTAIDTDQAILEMLGISEAEPIPENLLNAIPADTTAMMAGRWPQRRFLDTVRGAVEMAVGEADSFDQMLQSADGFLGVSLERDVLAAMDDFVFFYTRFEQANPFGGWVFGIRLRDEMSFQDTLNRISVRVERFAAESGLPFEKVPFANTTIWSIGENEMMIPTRLFWTLSGKYLVLSLDLETIKRQMLPPEGQQSLAEAPRVRSVYQFAEKHGLPSPLFVGEVDFGEILKIAYPFLTGMMADQPLFPESEMTFGDLPGDDVIGRGLKPNQVAVFKTEKGFQLLQRQTFPGAALPSTTAALMAWGLPIQLATETSSAMSQTRDNMREILIGLHNFHDVHSAFPAAFSQDGEGKKLLSWRVHLLPMLGWEDLYQEFHLDEPWDSEHNLSLVERMPYFYQHPKMELAPGRTAYLGVAGRKGFFVAPKKVGEAPLGNGMVDITDGTSNTVALVEVPAEKAVIWTQPSDFEFEMIDVLAEGLYQGWPSGAVLWGMADASVQRIALPKPEDLLKGAMTRGGNELLEGLFDWN